MFVSVGVICMGNTSGTIADRMTDHLMTVRRARDAKIAQKLRDGYRPRLDHNGKVILVKVKTKGGR